MIAASAINRACHPTRDLKVSQPDRHWVSDHHFIARAARVPARAIPWPGLVECIEDAKKMVRVPVEKSAGGKDGSTPYRGAGGETHIDDRYVPLLSGLATVRLDGRWKGAKKKPPVEERPIAGVNDEGEIVVVVMPFVLPKTLYGRTP